MRIETYRRRDKEHFSELQDFLDEVGQEAGIEIPNIYELLHMESAQIERLTVAVTRKLRFEDNHNFQAVEGTLQQNAPVVIGTKGILGQPRDVQWRSSSFFGPKTWEWRPVREQAIEVVARWDPAPTEPVRVLFNVWGE